MIGLSQFGEFCSSLPSLPSGKEWGGGIAQFGHETKARDCLGAESGKVCFFDTTGQSRAPDVSPCPHLRPASSVAAEATIIISPPLGEPQENGRRLALMSLGSTTTPLGSPCPTRNDQPFTLYHCRQTDRQTGRLSLAAFHLPF